MHEVLRQDPSVEVEPTGLGTLLSTQTRDQKANGMVSFYWSLQWLPFALMTNSCPGAQARLFPLSINFAPTSRPLHYSLGPFPLA